MQRNYCSSVVLLGAVLALLSGCGAKTKEQDSAVATAPKQATATSACEPANVEEDLVGPTWTVDNAPCGVGCDHAHLEVGNTITFTKNGSNFDVHGRYQTSGGALAPIGSLNNEVRGKIPAPHASGGETEHWLAAHLYVEDEARCGTQTPYDLRIAVCTEMPDSFDECNGDGQHGGYAHSHP